MYLKLLQRKNKLYASLATALLFLNLLSFNELYGQQKAIAPIVLQLEKASIVDVFNAIKKQSSYTIIYSDQVTALEKRVNLNINSSEINTILNLLVEHYGITYQVSGTAIPY